MDNIIEALAVLHLSVLESVMWTALDVIEVVRDRFIWFERKHYCIFMVKGFKTSEKVSNNFRSI